MILVLVQKIVKNMHTEMNRFLFLVNFSFDLLSATAETIAHQRIELF